MSLHTLSEWLRCPICLSPLTPREPLALGCPSGHAFDVNKRGFVTLLRSHGLIGDSAAMLDARDHFLGAGWYAPLRDAIAELASAENPVEVIDIGCGTGYYLGGVLDRVPAAHALALDLSPAAVGRTVRSRVNIDGLVADVWSPLPIRDDAADVILNVFAPRNAAEFARILRPDGALIVAIPQETHLRELRDAGLALSVQDDKANQLIGSLAEYFSLDARVTLSQTMRLTDAEISALVGMGPSAHHQSGEADGIDADAENRRDVSAAFEILVFRHASHTRPAV